MWNNNFMFNGGVSTPNVFQKPTMENPAMEGKNAELLRGTARGVFEVTDREAAAALCTHKDAKNFLVQPTGKVDNNGYSVFHCNFCGEQFPLWENLSLEEVQDICSRTVYLLQNIKFFGVDLTGEFLSVYAQMIPYISKLPKVYEVAINSFNKFSYAQTSMHSNNNNFAVLNGILAGNHSFTQQNPAMQYQAQQQPYYNNGMNMNAGFNNTGYGFGGMNQNFNNGMNNMGGMTGYDMNNNGNFNPDPMQNNFQQANSGFNMRQPQNTAPTNNGGAAANKKSFED